MQTILSEIVNSDKLLVHRKIATQPYNVRGQSLMFLKIKFTILIHQLVGGSVQIALPLPPVNLRLVQTCMAELIMLKLATLQCRVE